MAAAILDLLNSDTGKQIIAGISKETGAPQNKTADLLSMAVPVLMGAMQRNAATPQGAASLLNAVTQKHDGSILNNIGGLFQTGSVSSLAKDGSGILGHILGNKQTGIETALSQKTGLDLNTVASILKVAAPIIMGILGQQARQSGAKNSGDLTSILGGLLGGNSGSKQQSLIESFLDANGDGSILDDVAGMLMNSAGGQKAGGGVLGGFLGGILGGKK